MNNHIRRISLVLLIVFAAAGAAVASGDQEASFLITVEDVQRIVSEGETVILDIRDERSYFDGHIPGAILVPLSGVDAAAQSILELKASVITYCSCPAEESSLSAALKLRDAGVENVYVLVGGYPEWVKQQLPVVYGGSPL